MSGVSLPAGEVADRSANYVWDTGSLAFVVMTQPGAGSGGSGPVTIAEGADVSEGSTTDAEASGNGTVIGILKRLRTLLSNPLAVTGTFYQATQPVSIAAGVDVTDRAGRAVGVVSGAVTANAGTNLNTSALALEAGNLATIAAKDFATQATLALIKAKTDNIPADPAREAGVLATAAKQDTQSTKLDTILTELQQKTEPADVQHVTVDTLPAGLSTGANQTTEIARLDSLLTELGQKTEPADQQHVIVDTLPVITADVFTADADPGYAAGDLAKKLTQTKDGRLRVAIGALVTDAVESLVVDSLHSLSLTTDGRLRVTTASESYNFTPWDDPEHYPMQQSHIVGAVPLCAW